MLSKLLLTTALKNFRSNDTQIVPHWIIHSIWQNKPTQNKNKKMDMKTTDDLLGNMQLQFSLHDWCISILSWMMYIFLKSSWTSVARNNSSWSFSPCLWTTQFSALYFKDNRSRKSQPQLLIVYFIRRAEINLHRKKTWQIENQS